MVQVYGIRHHGPGSSKNVVRALRQSKPDAILVEGPADAQKVLSYASDPSMKPPVALLVYDPRQLHRSSYYPFARFSPEWQAIQYAYKHACELRFIDLPVSLQLENELSDALPLDADQHEDTSRISKDPLGYLAKIAGHADGESWWETTFEKWDAADEVFPMIAELMQQLRDELQESRPETLVREAHMRKAIRKAVKEGFENIAVICGAWHVPALLQWESVKASTDNSALRGLKKTKTTAVWVPWSYEQLSLQSGYGAGVHSPAWYELLFGKRQEAAMRWMTKAAKLLREKKINVSAAHVVEATRLANTLAAMRQQPTPTLPDLLDAALSVLCQGKSSILALIHDKLVVGDAVGRLSEKAPKTALQIDVEKQIRTARISKYWESAESSIKELDLRKPQHMQTSLLLHRLQAINIAFGELKKSRRQQQGTFKESWKLSWRPSFSMLIVRASQWGNTLESVAAQYLLQQLDEASSLSQVVAVLQQSLQAELPDTLEAILKELQSVMVRTEDIWELIQVLTPLIRAWRYSSIRQVDKQLLAHIVDELMPRINIGLPAACVGLSYEVAKPCLDALLDAHHYISLLDKPDVKERWMESLLRTNEIDDATPLLSGGITRLLFDAELYDLLEAYRRFHYALSPSADSLTAAIWLEGFLQQNGLLILYQPALWQLLNDWVEALPEKAFEESLPLLRRAFSEISRSERAKLMQLVIQQQESLATQPVMEIDMTQPVFSPIKESIDAIYALTSSD